MGVESAIEAVYISIEKMFISDLSPFIPYEDRLLDELVRSIKELGIITPIIVRDTSGRYEILSGNNRFVAAQKIGLKMLPAIVLTEITDVEAMLITTESNIIQRGFFEMRISERACCVHFRHLALKKQGLRSDLIKVVDNMHSHFDRHTQLTSIQLDGDYNSTKMLADSFGISKRNISRYIRIHMLIKPLKNHLDEGRISFSAAVDLSFLSEFTQEIIDALLLETNTYISPLIAHELRKAEQISCLSWKDVSSILEVNTNTTKTMVKVGIKDNNIIEILEHYSIDERERIIVDALKSYFEKNDVQIY